MREYDLQYICRVIGDLSGLPIRGYRSGRRLHYHSVTMLPVDPIVVCRDSIERITSHVGYYVTEQFHYYGVVNSGDIKIVIGPSQQVLQADQELRKLGFQADVSPEDMEVFVQGMKSIVCMPLDTLLQILCTINYFLNDETLGIKDIAICEAEQTDLLPRQYMHNKENAVTMRLSAH